MNASTFWDILTSAQVSTALVLIAAALVVIAIKLFEGKRSPSSRR